MKTIELALSFVVAASPVWAKSKPPRLLHDRPAVGCKLSFDHEWRAAKDSARKTHIEIYPLQQTDAVSFLKTFNDVEPKTDIIADEIIVVVFPTLNNTFVEFFKNGCATLETNLPPANFYEIMNEVFGDLPNATKT